MIVNMMLTMIIMIVIMMITMINDHHDYHDYHHADDDNASGLPAHDSQLTNDMAILVGGVGVDFNN